MRTITSGQFSDSYFPIMDGVGMTAHSYAYWLNEKYGQSLMIAPKVKSYTDHAPYKVFRFKSILVPGMNPYRIGLPLIDVKFKKKIGNTHFDVLHAHCPFVSGYVAADLAKKLRIPLVATFHTKYRDDFKKVVRNDHFVELMLRFAIDFYKSADLVWVPNQATGNTLREYGFSGRYEIMPNGTDMAVPGKEKLLKLRRKGQDKLNTDPDDFLMLFVGQHRWEKNIGLILDALRILKKEGAAFKMVFIGEGYASADIKKRVEEYNLKNHVRFMGVITDRSELRTYYAASDLFVFPSIYDNSPLVVQEAAAFNVPAILVRGSSAAEAIHDGENGFLTDNDPSSLATLIAQLIKNPSTLRNAGEMARRTIHHPWEDIVDDVYTRYIELIRNHKPV